MTDDIQIYLHTDRFEHVLDLLEGLVRTFDPADPDDLRTKLIMIVGDEGGIWPAYVFSGQDEGPVLIAA